MLNCKAEAFGVRSNQPLQPLVLDLRRPAAVPANEKYAGIVMVGMGTGDISVEALDPRNYSLLT
jgi:hypothetical protein